MCEGTMADASRPEQEVAPAAAALELLTHCPADSLEGAGKPVVEVHAFLNPRSGGAVAEAITTLRRQLGEDHVHDLPVDLPALLLRLLGTADAPETPRGSCTQAVRPEDPAAAAKFNKRLVLLACGGDGTFNWMLNLTRQCDPSVYDSIVLVPIPFGTGNDLHRSLGWGSHTPTTAKLQMLVGFAGRLGQAPSKDRDAPLCSHLDVWKVGFARFQPKYEPLLMQNYFSVGVLADCAEKVATLREKHPKLCKSPTVLKSAYAEYGLEEAVLPEVAPCCVSTKHKKPRLGCMIKEMRVDGVAVPVPKSAKEIIVLNIPSFSSGLAPWRTTKFPHNASPEMVASSTHDAIDDGRLEVIVCHQVFATMRGWVFRKVARTIQRHLGRPVKELESPSLHIRPEKVSRLAQGKVIELVFQASPSGPHTLSAQVDGEPMLFEPEGETITLQCAGGVPVCFGPKWKKGATSMGVAARCTALDNQ